MSELERFLSNLRTLLDANAPASGPEPARETAIPPRTAGATGAGTARVADAIDRELGSSPRATAVVSLDDAPEVEAFRRELIDGLIRVDTVNQFLRLANAVMARLMV